MSGRGMLPLSTETLDRVQAATFRYRWKGLPLIKSPFDLALIPLLIGALRPSTILEVGTHRGGSALWMRDMADALGVACHVHSADLRPPEEWYDNITFHRGDANGEPFRPCIIEHLPRPWLVVEDSAHTYFATLNVMRFFDRWLREGDYLIVEDGIVTALDEAPRFDGGPLRAIHQFLSETDGDYQIDRSMTDFWGKNLTWNPDGYIARVKCTAR